MKQLNISMESIAFQTGIFFKELVILVQDLRESDKTREDFAKFATRTDQCIYKHTGVNTNTRFIDSPDNAVVMMPSMTRGNVLNTQEFNNFLKDKFNPNQMSFYNLEKKGWIDPANSRVGGAFSEICFRMYVGDGFLVNKRFTTEEAASVILHETGHAYTILQFIADTVIVNTVLQRTYQELTNGDADKKVKFILTKAADDMQIKNRDWLQAVEDSTDKDVAFKVLVTAVHIEPRAMDNKRYFTRDACEELADIFAARHGAGRAIVSFRSKLNYESQSYPLLQGVAWTVAAMVTATCLPPIAAVMGVIGMCIITEAAIGAANEPSLSSFKLQAAKMRNQMVEKLKLSDLPKEEIREALENLDLTDKIIQSYVDDKTDPALLVKFFDMFRRGKMDAKSSREYTDRLERIAANDLFIHAAQFGVAAK